MSSYEIRTLATSEWPSLLAEIPQPPTELWAVGNLPTPNLKLLAVVGSRKYTAYGRQVTEKLISDLAGQPVGIISGLALGIDGLAHEAALNAGLYTLSIPGSGLDETILYPATHRRLARRIVESGGGLMSELSPLTSAARWTFPQRNRIMAGLSHATLLIEASEKSGTLITARLTVDYNRELLVVPGSIFFKNSYGTHQFLKLGATPVTEAIDILHALGIDPDVAQNTASFVPHVDLTPHEAQVIALLVEPINRDTIMRSLALTASATSTLLMKMELRGLITLDNNQYRTLR